LVLKQMPNFRKQEPVRMLLVAEEALDRAALVSLVSSWEEFNVSGEAATQNDAQEEFARLKPDVVLLSLAGTEEVDSTLVQDISLFCMRLVVLVGDCEEDFRSQLVRLGAKKVVPKKDHPTSLRGAIHTIYTCGESDFALTAKC
jgi:DNA-binding NarL/FixJ family response regulator